jgi:hypothetical protein
LGLRLQTVPDVGRQCVKRVDDGDGHELNPGSQTAIYL